MRHPQTLGVGRTRPDHTSHSSTHQIGKDVVVPNAILLQLHNLKDRTKGHSSVTPTPTLLEQWWRQLTSTGYLWHALLCPKYTKLYRPYHVTMVMLLASLTDEKEQQRTDSSSVMLCSYEEVTMGICSHQGLVWGVGVGEVCYYSPLGGSWRTCCTLSTKLSLRMVEESDVAGNWLLSWRWSGQSLGHELHADTILISVSEFCVLLPDWFSTQTLIDHSARVEREDWINPSKASLEWWDVAWSKEVIFPWPLCGLLVMEGQKFLMLDSFCMTPGHG